VTSLRARTDGRLSLRSPETASSDGSLLDSELGSEMSGSSIQTPSDEDYRDRAKALEVREDIRLLLPRLEAEADLSCLSFSFLSSRSSGSTESETKFKSD